MRHLIVEGAELALDEVCSFVIGKLHSLVDVPHGEVGFVELIVRHAVHEGVHSPVQHCADV